MHTSMTSSIHDQFLIRLRFLFFFFFFFSMEIINFEKFYYGLKEIKTLNKKSAGFCNSVNTYMIFCSITTHTSGQDPGQRT